MQGAKPTSTNSQQHAAPLTLPMLPHGAGYPNHYPQQVYPMSYNYPQQGYPNHLQNTTFTKHANEEDDDDDKVKIVFNRNKKINKQYNNLYKVIKRDVPGMKYKNKIIVSIVGIGDGDTEDETDNYESDNDESYSKKKKRDPKQKSKSKIIKTLFTETEFKVNIFILIVHYYLQY